MAGEWPVVSVADLESQKILLVQDGNHGEYRPRPDEFVSSGVAFIRAADMDNGRILFESASKINDVARRRITKGVGKPGDILLSHKGTVGKVASAPMDCPEFVCSPQTTFWRTLDGSKLDRGYLHAYLNGQHFRDQLASRSAETDMAPYVSLTSQRGLSMILPPITTQQAISRVLRPLDDKIELNRRMNATLEGISRAIFKSWFVDFDPVRQKAAGQQPIGMDAQTAALFPDLFEDSEIGQVPKGWGVGVVGDLYDITMGQSPPGHTYNESGVGLPFFQGRADFCFRYPRRRVFCTGPTRFADPGDTLVSVRAPVGDLNMALERCAIGRGVAAVRHKTRASGFTYYGMHALSSSFEKFEAEGTVFGSMGKKEFRGIKAVAPSEDVIHAFEHAIAPADNQIQNLERQTAALAALRDTLLPKLLSGEIRIPRG